MPPGEMDEKKKFAISFYQGLSIYLYTTYLILGAMYDSY
jgi:hypothetical protein